MSEQSGSGGKGSSFLGSFIPGLVLGVVVGLGAGFYVFEYSKWGPTTTPGKGAVQSPSKPRGPEGGTPPAPEPKPAEGDKPKDEATPPPETKPADAPK